MYYMRLMIEILRDLRFQSPRNPGSIVYYTDIYIYISGVMQAFCHQQYILDPPELLLLDAVIT